MVKTIEEALDKIYAHVDYSMTHAKNVSKDVFSLESIRILCKELGNPQKSYPVIHAAGTKGKGSTCAMLAAALSNAGLKTGLYTSPHLIQFNERFQIDGKMISDEEIVDLTNRVSEAVDSMEHVSSFEFMTAMAFEYFREQKVDIAVIETGLGGRLDSTNIVDPILTIITSISKDHTSFLGNTIEEIAAEKAGIIKENVPVICGCQPYPAAEKVIKDTAAKKNSPYISISDRYRFINQRENGRDSMMIWRVEDQKLMEDWTGQNGSSSWSPSIVPLPLQGLHQMQNTAAVFAALNKLRSIFEFFDFDKAVSGIDNTFWPCRFELLCKDKPLVADGAHNIDSIEKLCMVLDRNYGTKNITCIFGASEDKDLKSMIQKLAPHVDSFIMTRSNHPRAASPSLLAKIASETGRKNQIAETLEEAYAIYTKQSSKDSCFLVTGSLFVAGGIRELFMKDHPELRYFGTE